MQKLLIILWSIGGMLLMKADESCAQPSRNWLSYFGGHYTQVSATHYDPVCDCIYMAGFTGDTGIASAGSFKENFSPAYFDTAYDWYSTDIFLSRFDLEGNRVWTTYYGGDGDERSVFIKSDHSGNIYLAGCLTISSENNSGDIATPDAMYPEGKNTFIAKFNQDGERLWATFLHPLDSLVNSGGSNGPIFDFDDSNNVYIVTCDDFDGAATPGAYQEMPNIPDTIWDESFPWPMIQSGDVLLMKLDSNGVKQWGTYMGGHRKEYPRHITVADGQVYVTGCTSSPTGFGTPGVYQSEILPGTDTLLPGNGSFLIKFNTAGLFQWSTYLLGTNLIMAENVCTDQAGNIYVSGITESQTHIATPGALQPELYPSSELSDSVDLFIMKFNPEGQRLWGTYFGGPGFEIAYAYANYDYVYSLRYAANVNSLYFCGYTSSSIPYTDSCSYRTMDDPQGFLSKIDTAGHLIWASHYDAPVGDISIREVQDGVNDIFICGRTPIDSLATAGAFQDSKPAGKRSGFLGRFEDVYDCSTDSLHINWNPPSLVVEDWYDNYQWYQNGNAIPGASGASYIPQDTILSLYSVTASICDCIIRSDTVNFRETGIMPPESLADLRIYPNPTSGNIVVELPPGRWAGGKLTVFNTAGQKTYSGIIPRGAHTMQFNTASWPAGSYFVRLVISDRVWTGHFEKQ